MPNSFENYIGKIFLTPSESVYMYRNRPDASAFQTAVYGGKFVDLRSQYVMAVNSNNSDRLGDLYYQILFKDGQMFWIHCFDLIKVDQKTGQPILPDLDSEV
jgi:hypothetical protein